MGIIVHIISILVIEPLSTILACSATTPFPHFMLPPPPRARLRLSCGLVKWRGIRVTPHIAVLLKPPLRGSCPDRRARSKSQVYSPTMYIFCTCLLLSIFSCTCTICSCEAMIMTTVTPMRVCRAHFCPYSATRGP